MKKLKLIAILLLVMVFGYLGAETDNPMDAFSGLIFFPALAVSKETSPADISTEVAFNNFKARLLGGDIYMGLGGYNTTELAAIVDGMDHLTAELTSNYDKMGEVAEGDDAIAFSSTAKELKTRTTIVEGKRETVLKIQLVGYGNVVKDYLESSNFNANARSFILLADGDANDFAILNGLNWVANWEAKANGLKTYTLSTTIGGRTAEKVLMYSDVAETVV